MPPFFEPSAMSPCVSVARALSVAVAVSLPAQAADLPPDPTDISPPAPSAFLEPAPCTLIDTDFDIDDMMAIPLVIGNRYVAGIITSEGYTLPQDGAAALSRLIAEPGQRPIPVIIGASSHLSSEVILKDWGQFVLDYRSMMGSAFALLSAALPPSAPADNDYVQDVADVLGDCKSVDILVIGTFTSFINYSSAIRSKIKNVVIMGIPPRGDPTQRPGNFSFNCEYDMKACETAFDKQLPQFTYSFVEPKRTVHDATPVGHQDTVYGPTSGMVDALESRGLPNALKQALVGTVRNGSLGAEGEGKDYWAIDCCFKAGGKSLLWDQSAALFLVRPEAFINVGGSAGHYEPALLPDDFRALWTSATNASVTYHHVPAGQ